MKKPRRELHAHEMVVELAREMTLATYENLMGSSNEIWKVWRAQYPGARPLALQALFIKKFLARHIEPARATLAGMLALPYDDELKSRIHDALLKDATLTRGRAAGVRAVVQSKTPTTENGINGH